MKSDFFTLLCGMMVVFSGCFGGDEEAFPEAETPHAPELQAVTVQGVAMNIPATWDFFDRAEHPDKFPADVLFLASAVEPWGSGDIFATVAVAREQLPARTSHKKYTTAAVKKTQNEIINYEEISKEDMNIGEREAKLLRFRGKSSMEDETLEWLHLFLSRDDMGYVVSGTTPMDASKEKKQFLRNIVMSFTFAE